MVTSSQNIPSVTKMVGDLDRDRRRQIRKHALIRGLWVGLLLLFLSFYLDTVIILSATQRLMAAGSLVILVLALCFLTIRRANLAQSKKRMLARMVEAEHPELNNELINAIDFEEQLKDQSVNKTSSALMGKGIERAQRSLADLKDPESLKPAGLRRESRCLLAALGLWLVLILFLNHWVLTELWRFVDTHGDHPPYSATRLLVQPAGAVVEYGKDLTIQVTTEGRIPDELWLAVQEPGGGPMNRVGMFSNEAGQFHQTIENIRSELTYHAALPRGRSKYYQIRLSKTPRIEAVEARYQYPAYARLQERTTSLTPTQSELKGYQGTRVTLSISSNRPLESGEVQIGDASVTCTRLAENSVQATFPLTTAGEFQISVTDIEGNASNGDFTGRITLVPDGRPAIAIVSPGMQALATPTSQVPIVIEAQDDLGIRNIGFFCSLNESEDAQRSLYHAEGEEAYVQVVRTLDLADLGLRPGDEIDYYATATDSLPGAPQTVASEPYRIQIISEEQLAAMQQREMSAKDLRQKYDRILGELEKLVQAQQALREETEALEKALSEGAGDSTSATKEKQLTDLAGQQAQLAEQTEALAAQLAKEAQSPPAFDIEEDYKKGLSQIAQQLQKAATHMKQGSRRLAEGSQDPQSSQSSLGQAGKAQDEALAAMGAETEATRDAIRQANREIEKMMDLLVDVETFKQLYLAQKQVTRQTRSLRDIEADDFDKRIRFKELAERETTLQTNLNQLEKNLRDHGEAILEAYPKVTADANRIADEIVSRGITELMGQGAKALNRGNGPQAYPAVNEALTQMEAMIGLCESASGSACQNCEFRLQIKMNMNLGDTLAQLSQGFGMGMGMGSTGALGRGSSGFGGGQSPMAVFGSDTFGDNTVASSMTAGGGKQNSEAGSLPDVPNPLAGNIEALSPQAKREMELEVKGEGRMMAEYSELIEAYFRRMAEDDQTPVIGNQ